jgi:hypothetical protein
MTTSLLLIALVTVCRIVPHEWNLVAVGAVALYAGARLPRRWAWAVPIAGMILSDLILDWGHAEPERAPFTVSRLTIYGTYIAIAFLGILARRARGWTAPFSLGALALAGSSLFFLTTNFAEWIAGPLNLYPRTWAGLVACYTAAIPFFDKTLAADLIGTGVLFGLDALVHRVAERRGVAEPAKVELVEA